MLSVFLLPIQKLNYYIVSVYRCMVCVYGRPLQLSIINWKLPYFEQYGLFLGVVTQGFYTLLLTSIASTILHYQKLSLVACKSSSSLSDIFSECKLLAYTSVGYIQLDVRLSCEILYGAKQTVIFFYKDIENVRRTQSCYSQ